MGTSAKVGNFTLNSTALGNQSITGLGFKPKLVIFWSQHVYNYDSNHDGSATSNMSKFFGAASSSSSRWCSYTTLNVTDNTNVTGFTVAKCIQWMNSYNDNTILVAADFVSLDNDGFTINITDGQPGTATSPVIYYMALGGSSLSAKVGTFSASGATTSPGTVQTINGIGFSPRCLIFSCANQMPDNNEGMGGGFTLGWATNTSASSQSLCGYWEYPDAYPITAMNAEYVGACFGWPGYLDGAANGWWDNLGVLSSLGSDGFSVTWKSKESSSTQQVGYIALGGSTKFTSGVITQPASTGVQTITTTGVRPVAQLFMSTGNSSSGTTIGSNYAQGNGVWNDHSMMMVGGASDPAQQGMFSHFYYTGSGTGPQASRSSTNAVGRYGNTGSSFNSLGALSTELSQSFQINWTTVSSTQVRYPYLVIGDLPTASSRMMIGIF